MEKVNSNEEIKDETSEIVQKKPFKRYIFGAIVVVCVTLGTWLIYDTIHYQSTDDAYVETTTVQVAPKVTGQVVEVFVTDNQKVKEGDLVAKIDSADYQIKLAQAEAKYERALLNQKNAKANYSAVKSEIDVARKDLIRYKNLFEDGAVSKQTLDAAQAKYDAAQARLTNAEESILSSSNNKVADAEIKELRALRDMAKLNLSYTNVYAPQSGTVSNRRVEKGMYVQTGAPLFVIVPEDVWVVANFKENQLKNMKPNQSVDIKVDTYPDKVFKGKIDSIQRSSGAKSSLFPPENAVGSFVKIVQRIPVKIVFTENIDTNEYNIVPGMSVVPKVRVK